MPTLKPLLTLALLLTTLLTRAQNVPSAPPGLDSPYIEVSGTAEKEVVPDEIYLRISLRERYAGKTKVTLEEQEEKLKAAVKSLGIDLANLALSDANADYVRVRRQQKDVLTSKDYALKVPNAATASRVFAELDRLEITDASIARVGHSQLESLRREVKILAIKAAKTKADYLLAAIGERVGRPLVVVEQEVRPSFGFRSAESNTISTEPSGSNDVEVEFQKVKVQSTIYVKFAIK